MVSHTWWWHAVPVLRGRTALQCYFDLMYSFHNRFKQLYSDADNLIQEIAIGMGPDGELRYPSFRSEKWEFPGVRSSFHLSYRLVSSSPVCMLISGLCEDFPGRNCEVFCPRGPVDSCAKVSEAI
jgi:hypothetical protein